MINRFNKCYLNSDLSTAKYQDINLIQPWGITTINDTIWLSNYAQISNYHLSGELIQHIPIPPLNSNPIIPTGIIHNSTKGFVITSGPNTASAFILVASKNGAIYAYNKYVDDSCVKVIDKSSSNANYTGLAIIDKYLCATDYHNNTIDVFNLNFVQVDTLSFADLDVLNPIPTDVAPYNIVNINKHMYVVYTRQPDSTNTINIPVSYVSVFNKKGLFVKRLISNHPHTSWEFILYKQIHYLLGNTNTISIFDLCGINKGYAKDHCNNRLILHDLNGLHVHHYNKIYFTTSPVTANANHGILGILKQPECQIPKITKSH